MAKSGPAKYTAVASLLGYLYQCRYALLLMLRRTRTAPTIRVAIEKFDDVSFDDGVSLREAVQTKYKSKPGNLTDASEDWWNTLRIWCEGVRDRHFLLPGMSFSLITTETAPPGSAAEALRAVKGTRDATKAESLLLAAAATSTNQKLTDAFDVFRKLKPVKRLELLNEVWVFDAQCSIGDLDNHLLEELRFAAPRGSEGAFLERVEGWWLRRIIRHLAKPKQPPIAGGEVQDEIDRMRDGYATDNLPIELPLPNPPQPPDPATDPRQFVQSLRRLGLTDDRLRKSILDFYRATVHRDRWVTETLVNFEEIEDYDDRLVDEWDRLCDSLMDELARPGIDPVAWGRNFFYRLDQDAGRSSVFFIRPRCTEPAISRGSLHMLAEAGRLGWHPDDVTAARGAAAGGVP